MKRSSEAKTKMRPGYEIVIGGEDSKKNIMGIKKKTQDMREQKRSEYIQWTKLRREQWNIPQDGKMCRPCSNRLSKVMSVLYIIEKEDGNMCSKIFESTIGTRD